ncbi:hypothetical protein AB0L13_29855 [Saccharopolyspora shandongensis]|uniref:hypothetical protein n=1 Tax=Saccharopolyspora shandongensis TaxID=418495 RepID=UPI00343F48BB
MIHTFSDAYQKTGLSCRAETYAEEGARSAAGSKRSNPIGATGQRPSAGKLFIENSMRRYLRAGYAPADWLRLAAVVGYAG